jgi:plasmid stabilization system protein ParE
MSRRFVVRDGAQAEVDRVRDDYEDQRAGLGDRFFDEVVASFRAIEAMPLRFPEVEPDVRRALMRRFPYAVYFYVDANLVAVLTLVHQKRDRRVWRARVAEELEKEPEQGDDE